MKKLFLPFLAVAAIAMTSCSSKSAEATDENVDEAAALKAKIENCTDPDSLQIYVQQAAEYAASLQAEGNNDAANAFVSEVVTVVTSKNTTSLSLLETLKAYADSTTTTAIDNATGVKSAAESVATDAVEGVVDAADAAKTTAVNAATDAASKADAAAQAAKAKAESDAKAAAEATKNKAANAIQSAADKAKSALGK